MAEKLRFEIYLTDTLYYMARHQSLQRRYSDLLPKENKNSKKTGDEIASSFLKKWEGGIK